MRGDGLTEDGDVFLPEAGLLGQCHGAIWRVEVEFCQRAVRPHGVNMRGRMVVGVDGNADVVDPQNGGHGGSVAET